MTPIAVSEIVSAIYVLIMLISHGGRRDHSVCMKRQLFLMLLTIIWLLADAFSYLVNPTITDNIIVISLINSLNLLAYVMSNVVVMGFSYYCDAYISEKTKLSRWVFKVPIFFMGINVVVDAIFYAQGKIVIQTDSGFKMIGTAPVYVLASYIIFLLYAPAVAFVKRKDVGTRSVLVLASYIIPIVAAITVLIVTGKDYSVFAGAVAVLFGVTLLQRELTDAKLEKEAADHALAENNARILLLEDKFESLYDVEIESGKYEMYIKGQTFGNIYSKMVKGEDFYADIRVNIKVVWPSDREGVLYAMKKEYIRKALEKEQAFDWYYRLNVDEKPVWSRLRCVYKGENKNNVIIGVFNAEQEIAAKRKEESQEIELIKTQLRADALAFVSDNEPDLDKFLDFFGNRLLEISKCDQVSFHTIDGVRKVYNAPGIEEIPIEICDQCPFAHYENDIYCETGNVLMNNCKKGYKGVMPVPECPAKSSFNQRIYLGEKIVGLLALQYISDYHTFSENGIDIMETVTTYLGLLIGRIDAQKTERARIEAESSNKAKTDFLFNMSHDIRTPMNAIIGFTNIAKKNLDNREKLVDSLDKTQEASNLLLSLINSILDMSRIESGKAVLEEVPGNVRYSFANIRSTMQELASTKNIELTFEVTDIKDYYVFVDYERCMRVFINIITNSIKYTEHGGCVKVCCRQVGRRDENYGLYQYTIEDNGIGMSEDFQKHLFERFTREENSTTRGIQGTGLGLSVVKSFVDLMNGTIEVESRQNVGTKFTVTLPFRIQNDLEKQEYINPDNGIPTIIDTVTEEEREIDYKGKKVLLVEDNDLNREIAIDILEEEGFIVETAQDGAVAVNIMRDKGKDYYDFILMDIQMPVMGGFEATETIRKMYPDMSVPIIALSANAFSEDKERSIASGMNDHVAKPISINELFRVLAKYI